MVAFTPNRAYPYPTPTDPADVPASMQALAEAIDDDLEGRDTVIRTRPYAKIRGTATTPVPANVGQVVLPFDVEDFDTDDMADLSVNRNILTVRTAGFYWIHARLRMYQTGPPQSIPFYILALIHNGTTAFSVGRYHTLPVIPNYFDGTISAGRSLAVGDTLSLSLSHNNPNDTNISRFRELSAFKVAN